MQRTEPPLIAVAICLAALAGFVDALAFTSLGGFFASFMSGNSTRLAVSWAIGARGDAMVAGALILSFVSGAILAAVIARAAASRSAPMLMGAVAALFAIAALVSEVREGPLASLFLAAGMGAVHLLLRREGATLADGLSLTNALVRAGEGIADAMMGGADRWGWLPHLLLWSGFLAGAGLGSAAFFDAGFRALWFAVLAAGVLTLWFGLRGWADRIPG